MTIELYHNDMSVCSAKVRMALAEKGLAWTAHHLNLRAGDAQQPEYVKLNPGQVVPTLVHDGVPVIESNVIIEYIEDAWPAPALRPADPYDIARMRLWMKQLDEGVHAATGTVSTCIAFRIQQLKRPPADYQAWLANMVDAARRERSRANVERGVESPFFAPAVQRFDKLARDMERALAGSPWLAGPAFSLADIAYAPYLIRLEHLGLDDMIIKRPRVAAWRDRLFARSSYKSGIAKWFNPGYLDIFSAERDAARAKARQILG
ncbi:MAG: glutathione S-transferase family protein [Betaproteobacteria bacterium]|nr:glutathione S-transferase family protein [Betaproteobacteria bacterium]